MSKTAPQTPTCVPAPGCRTGSSFRPHVVLAALVAATVLAAGMARAGVDIDFTVDDIKGVPSKAGDRDRDRREAEARRKAAEAARRRRERRAEAARRRMSELTRLASAKKASSPVVEVPFQNWRLTLRTPGGRPAAGVRVVATVHARGAAGRTVSGLVTGPAGTLVVRDVGPLPAVVEWRPDGKSEAEWELRDQEAATVLIGRPSGKPVGRRLADQAGRPVALAIAGRALPPGGTRPAAPGHPKATVRAVTYEGPPHEAVVERQVVDVEVVAPPGTTVDSPALSAPARAGADGRARLVLALASLGSGCAPLRVRAELPGGRAEEVIRSYPTDPYAANRVEASGLRLVQLTKLRLDPGLDVLADGRDVERTLGKPESTARTDSGASLWGYPSRGIAVTMRRTLHGRTGSPVSVVERVRIDGVAGGEVGGVRVGSTRSEVLRCMGVPDAGSGAETAGTVDRYLEGGVALAYEAGRVASIEVARPRRLLAEGTTAFVPRRKPRLFVDHVEGDARAGLRDRAALVDYLRGVTSMDLADAPNDADLILSAAVARFEVRQDTLVGGLPFRFGCTTALRYTLVGAPARQPLFRDRIATAETTADFADEVQGGADQLASLRTERSTRRLLRALGGPQGVVRLQQSMVRAARRCPLASTRDALARMVYDVTRAADFAVRVVRVDYARGELEVNAGTAEGVRTSSAGVPTEFEVLVGGRPLPRDERGHTADYYTAVAVEASEHTSRCELRHVWRSEENGEESAGEVTDPEAIEHIPDPATGIVSARGWLPYPPLDAQALVPAEPVGARNAFEQLVFRDDADGREWRDYREQAIESVRREPPGAAPALFVVVSPVAIGVSRAIVHSGKATRAPGWGRGSGAPPGRGGSPLPVAQRDPAPREPARREGSGTAAEDRDRKFRRGGDESQATRERTPHASERAGRAPASRPASKLPPEQRTRPEDRQPPAHRTPPEDRQPPARRESDRQAPGRDGGARRPDPQPQRRDPPRPDPGRTPEPPKRPAGARKDDSGRRATDGR